MKNFKKTALGLIVGAMAIGISAFTNAHTNKSKAGFSSYLFVHSAHSTSNLRTDYVYTSNPNDCTASTDNCKSLWSQSSAPAEGANPATNAIQGTITQGDYQ